MAYQHTVHWVVDKHVDNLWKSPEIKEAAAKIAAGELVAFPTETVYGLGASARFDEAVKAIFQAKGRPADNPLIVHIAKTEDVNNYTNFVPDKAWKLIHSFWPGPLTIILRHNSTLSTSVTAGLDTVALRMPDHPVALALIAASGEPLAAPSANRSGRPSPTTAAHVAEDLDGRIAGILNGGATGVGLESTVIDCSAEEPVILRPGGVTRRQIEEIIGPVALDEALTEETTAPRSPGMKYQHYAPEAPLTLVDGDDSFFHMCITEHRKAGERVGVIIQAADVGLTKADVEYVLPGKTEEEIARELYGALRTFKKTEVDHIFMRVLPAENIGFAIMNRLVKAAGGRIRSQHS
ncbi:L-threonylcarbamoyladenylate synthase [Alkalicoccus halolimnae]|uniref:Threonylcarbamoyl-AMP synthase n=1 Tax=Alkalicoccus halolimnae TaxID=1667239 RepID=A0A5C7F8C3_9BACI|nr:L-threonylcarbamoyladenylate synthase [Alkalicoccus halolimnae]TXF86941.1 threonylcarbamoyl-AMP synthase [Alkalicoccus halolimnae]